MSKTQSIVSRTGAVAAAAILAVAALLPTVVMLGRADAAQVSSRSVQLSNSATGATSVEYTIKFTLATASTNLEGVVVDICAGDSSPLVGVACTAPSSFSWGTPTIDSAFIGSDDVSAWTPGLLNGGRTLTLSDATGVATAASDVVTIVVSGVSNPSDVDTVTVGNQVGTFYGRMLTFNDSAQVANYLATNGTTATGVVDFGGSAMSTTNDLTVTARVQENIRFCLYTNGPAQTCATGTGNAIDIPDATTPLNANSVSTANAYFNVSSNALSGVNIRMWSNNGSDGVLKSGVYTISAFGPTVDDVCTANSANTSVEQFGLRINPGASVTAVAPYNCAAGNHGWDADNTAGSGANDATTVGSAYGDTVATTAGANDASESTLEFAAKSALTTEAGIYTTALNYIATGTY